MKLFKDNVIIIKGTPYEIVAQNPSTIWINDGDRVIPLEYHHTSLCRGYVSTKSKGIVEGYSGKFGTGVTVKEHNSRSSRYCYISYYILIEQDATVSVEEKQEIANMASSEETIRL